jgi:hypothetical protein
MLSLGMRLNINTIVLLGALVLITLTLTGCFVDLGHGGGWHGGWHGGGWHH